MADFATFFAVPLKALPMAIRVSRMRLDPLCLYRYLPAVSSKNFAHSLGWFMIYHCHKNPTLLRSSSWARGQSRWDPGGCLCRRSPWPLWNRSRFCSQGAIGAVSVLLKTGNLHAVLLLKNCTRRRPGHRLPAAWWDRSGETPNQRFLWY